MVDKSKVYENLNKSTLTAVWDMIMWINVICSIYIYTCIYTASSQADFHYTVYFQISIPLNLSSSFYILEQLNFFLYDLIIHIKNKSADAAFCGCHIWLDTSKVFFSLQFLTISMACTLNISELFDLILQKLYNLLSKRIYDLAPIHLNSRLWKKLLEHAWC